MVPTLWAEALLTTPISFGGQSFKAGEVIKVAYGVALQGLTMGTFAVIKDADAVHAQAINYLQQYGPDSWFPAPVQTLGKFWNYVEQERRKKGDKPTELEAPRTPTGEIVH